MIVLRYCEWGTSVSDFDANAWIEKVIGVNTKFPSATHIYDISTSLPILVARRMIAEGTVERSIFTFTTQDSLESGFLFHNLVEVNEYGAAPDSDLTFCGKHAEEFERIARAAMKKRRSKED